ncbi:MULTISPECIES: ABC-F family ATP-binding cassette domain-containing protein [Flavobacterium]|mgnify:FL=1|jgi:ATP-binding cassette subfamily F protein 3|uniref:ABC-F family ATP-binding cassette domain-containing protein n=1 Tax=Flavobacterium TaxID=237 RepID=UPI0006F56FD9|nr:MULTISPECIES: ABC-F family ATP-binding cassette domain-containing protein [Flavobacterium]MBU7571132.1 ABC-F family ATP-binding cassette domain-containing protein [Flavobacterium sp.]PZQ92417.1 MAG: ABC transporter ATP-binding protein [Flavobacterium johnsoniae]KQS50353.1 glycosyl transferase family 2 [Flavobacterium sp. Leaf359]MBL7867128.1 ABC-F family ATP-binding cassette domain-containing protein [Flavobacterium lindanitolerans]MDQ7959693.1 ABC-F family ATP-binding cassette domain-conta
MLNIHNLSVSFGGTYLFEEITFRLGAGDRVGLVGKNGAGKSTMLKILARDIAPDTGSIATEKEVKIGFLRQDIDFEQGRTVLEEAYEAFTEIKIVEKKLEEINKQLVERTDYESEEYSQIIEDLSDYTHRFDLLGGYNYVGDTEKILLGLGFKREDFNNQTETFSGGWRMRIELAKLLLQSNDILLLDEPTNHLDIESIIWLESFLRNFPGVVVIVSHDKMFLDNVTNRTIEISLGKAYDFNKPYTQYLQLRQEIREKQLATQKNQAKKIEETEKLIEKFRAKASKASMAQSLIKKLDKVERIEVDEDDNSVMNISFPVSVTPGKVVVEAENVTKKYGDKTILKDISLLVERGSKIAFVGQNGQGKSTFIKAIVNEIDYTGTIKLGHNVQLGYFAQNQAEYLDGEITLLQTMQDAANDTNRSKVRDMLGSFLFRGDDVEKKVKVLSGGERNRLALCKLLLQPINVLVMDEPTNHLDIKSKNVLKAALQQYEGTLLLVSHDRDFLQGMSNIVYEFKNQKIKEYLGDINFFLEQRNLENMREVEKKDVVKKETPKEKSLSYDEQKKNKALQNKLSKVESQIKQLEIDIQKDDKLLESEYDKHIEDASFFIAYNKKKKDLDNLLEEWEAIQMEIENA